MFAHYNSDTAGISLKKTTPELFLATLDSYEKPVAWVKKFLHSWGYNIQRVELDPYTCSWRFYSDEGSFITSLSHEWMERLLEVTAYKRY